MNKSTQGKYCYEYPHAALTADCVIFGFDGKLIRILLVERGNEPYLGYWALPGGFMHIDETIEEAAARELQEETNLSHVYLEQFRVYSRVARDPRERVVTVAFIALVKPEDYEVIAGDDAANARWFDANMLPPLAFDHREIVRDAREHLKEILKVKPVAFELLGKCFTMPELQTLYEVINETSYDRRNFMRTALDSALISEVDDTPEDSISSELAMHCCAEPEPMNDMCEELEEQRPAGIRSSGRQPKRYTFHPDSAEGAREYKSKTKSKGSTKGLFDFLKFTK